MECFRMARTRRLLPSSVFSDLVGFFSLFDSTLQLPSMYSVLQSFVEALAGASYGGPGSLRSAFVYSEFIQKGTNILWSHCMPQQSNTEPKRIVVLNVGPGKDYNDVLFPVRGTDGFFGSCVVLEVPAAHSAP